jgi:hypothetical protein
VAERAAEPTYQSKQPDAVELVSREIFTSKFGQYLAERGPFDPHPFAQTHFGDGPFLDSDYFNWKNRRWVDDGISLSGYFSPNFLWGSGGENYAVGEFLFFGIWEPIRHDDRAGRIIVGFAHDQTIGSLTTRKFANSENIVETTDDLDTDPDKTFTTLGLLAWEYEHLTAADAGFAYRAGQLFLPTYFAGAVYLDDDRRFFLARPLAAAGGAQWAGANDIGLGAHIQGWMNGFYASLAIADGDADRKAPSFSSLADGRLLYVTEFGFEQDLDGPDAFSIRLTLSHLDETQRDGVKPPGEAAIVSISRKFADRWAVAGRWSKSYRRLTSEYKELYSLALLRLRPFGFDDDFAGFGVFVGEPTDATKGTEYGAELNYKFRLTQALSVMPDVQYWHRNDSGGAHIRSWVIGFRLNIEY